MRPRPGLADASHSLADALRRRLRASDVWFIALALLVGVIAGLLTLLQSSLAHGAQALLYGLEADERLSAMSELSVHQLLVLPLGGLLVGLLGMAARARKRQLVDAVEANALYGGRMSMRDNLIVSVQTLFSNGVGASVGLEAAYTQMGAGSGSHLGRVLRLRRADIRTLVGAGAGAAIAAAFGAPLAGAFYAFEIVIGAYSPSALAPVAVASLGAVFVSQLAGVQPYLLPASAASALEARDYVLYALLGVLCALLAVAVMRLIGAIEQAINRSPLPRWARPVAGGLLLIPLALITPQVLSSGHGALHLDLTSPTSLRWLGILLLLKCLGSAISLGFGFRGGLFFASLFMGSLVGGLFAGVLNLGSGMALVDGTAASLAGMAAMAAAVIGAPMTMAMLVLEGTHDFVLASAVMVAVLVANTIVRQIFGYSFSTWRLHLRGETIKSARDVGWVKHLSAGRMMQKDVHPLAATTSVAEFRRRFPLGSGTRVVLEDESGHYAGLVTLAAAYADGVNADAAIVDYAGNRDVALPADTDVVTAMRQFDLTQSDELAVVDEQGKVLGVLSESFVRKRYAEELDKRQRELMGERVDD
ncbi:chloride channel protein [Xanthomonas sp. A2111]|uniref:Chloride channel protein n=1 Tax=Xanthomonas hawaiiensis TaxID=3003247 RepID=A0ABU2I940_9XANT|nr:MULTISPECIES: chloride channel protein [unclassified Xanthomonas]MBO9827555.1 chloride channel protein [Xanthomonas sp. A2111]MBO9872420.1 chloride channel protein [Xanthomonas sp. D-93]MDS9994355.1 chloride channel protein [Xanthomonas sp. A2111]WNH46876.1 chloride channel protein [Xanthomonas sp. A6251]